MPNPALTMFLKLSTLKRERRTTPSIPVIWKGRASVIHMVRQKSSMPMEICPCSER